MKNQEYRIKILDIGVGFFLILNSKFLTSSTDREASFGDILNPGGIS